MMNRTANSSVSSAECGTSELRVAGIPWPVAGIPWTVAGVQV